ncbi:Uu.00g111670.m01.CDS01 [Anthostomella pinea]|uniref:Uu.00g111670.m01.CDS01 n=1 Tax=Anthostomella pinea TaxID=933095 RepID=A0AAI8VG71_9PEZI|nr:Uu.00g111670.m01.CDS01 [Anthostomella pinea]
MASNNTTFPGPSELSATNLTNAMAANQTFFEKLASVPSTLVEHSDLLVLETRIVFTALACIYIGAHGALRRPPSASLPKKSKKGDKQKPEDAEGQFVQGLLPSDAIMFPILAGTVLIGLYYLIKWLEDPDILNTILRVYFSFMSFASMGKLFADGLQLLTGFVFPTVWTGTDGNLYHVDSEKRGHWYAVNGSPDREWDEKKKSPLPGRWSAMRLSGAANSMLWGVRHLLLEQWTVRLFIHGIVNENIKVKFNDIVGFVLAVGANLIYYTTKSTFLSNIMGYAFSYAGIILMSPTTFATGSGVLFGLFFYDIVMVFYTPYMVTVATKLDVPIKLVFEGPTKASMLGLGDIVIPGMFIGLCLRFDNYMHYYRQRKLVPVELITEVESAGHLVTNQETQRMVVKPEYFNPQGQWGDRFWGTKFSNILSPDATPALKASAFPKTYFHAAMIGYLLSMMTTLVMLLTFKHAQPALLYLVPGVVFAVWLTGAARGELREMWAYTEDGSLDKTDVIVEVDGNGDILKEVQDDEKKEQDSAAKKDQGSAAKKDAPSPSDAAEADPSSKKITKQGEQEIDDRKEAKRPRSGNYSVFVLRVEAPAPGR